MSAYLTNTMAAGILFLVCGLAFVWMASGLSLGTISNPGSGFLPLGIGCGLLLIGGGLVVQEIRSHLHSDRFTLPPARPFLAVLGIVAFGLTLEPLGLIIASFLLISIAMIAYGRVKLLELAGLSVILISACILVFVLGLGQRIPLLP